LSHGQLPADAQVTADADARKLDGTHVRMIDITDGQVIGAAHTDFPLFVTLSALWLRSKSAGGAVESPSGYDIGFSLDRDGSQLLAHEIEAYRGTTGDLVAWVKLPMLAPTTTLYIRYGDAAITTSLEKVAEVWSGGYAGVWHLGTNLSDSLGISIGTSTGSMDAAGRIERARSFDGLNNTITLGSAASIDNVFMTGGTLEAWIRPDTFGEENRGRIFDKSDTTGGNDTSGWSFGVDTLNVPNGLIFAHTASSSDGFWNAAAVVSTNAWWHLVLTYTAGSGLPLMYVNGVNAAVTVLQTMQGAAGSDATHPLMIGSRTGGDRTFDGLIDEARLSRVVRTPEWIQTTYRNQNQPLAFYSISEEL
jgi:hypothetical protein